MAVTQAASQAKEPIQIKGIRLQSSVYGMVRPLIWGTNRLQINLIWTGPVITQKG